jgi:cytochrome c biogenesis protein CcmG/thiol:disulfide interchange protein DsbE
MKARYLVPLGIFLVIMVFLYLGLGRNPREVPSVLINKPAAAFTLPDLFDPDKTVDSASMQGRVWLLNVWGTWCAECWREHEFLVYLAKQEGVPIVGIDWRDDAEEARKMIAENGNPFIAIGSDPESRVIMNYGVYGAPETFLIDRQGIIRWKRAGAITPELWSSELQPLLTQYREAK